MKKNKLIYKKILILTLAVVLIVLNVDSPTFSWFPRDEERSGAFLKYDVTSSAGIKAYDNETEDNASVSIKTLESNAQGNYVISAFEEEFYAPLSTSNYSISAKGRKSYKTTITSSGGADRYVSLYIDKLYLNTGEFCLGVSSPVCRYKDYLETRTDMSDDATTKRIYFQTKAAPNWSAVGRSDDGLEVVWWAGNSTDVADSQKIRQKLIYLKYDSTNGYTYYSDIGEEANYLYFHIVGQNETDGYVSQRFDNLLTTYGCTALTTKVFYAQAGSGGDGYAYNGYGNLDVGISQVNGAHDTRKYNSVLIPKNKTVSTKLTRGVDCVYSSISYASDKTSVFTVSNGTITAKAPGKAKLTTTLTGAYGDKIVLETNVMVTDTTFDDVPIITNYYLPANESLDVYWFIQNDSGSTMSYTMSGVYLAN